MRSKSVSKKEIKKRKDKKKFNRKLRFKHKKNYRNKQKTINRRYLKDTFEKRKNITLIDAINAWMPPTVYFLLTNNNSNFNLATCKSYNIRGKRLLVPKTFCLIENEKESYRFCQYLIGKILSGEKRIINIDYSQCRKLGLAAQVLLDIILMDLISFVKKCNRHAPNLLTIDEINGKNVNDDLVKKILLSVGSPSIHTDFKSSFSDIIPYNLCVFDKSRESIEQKDIDTTELVDYVINSLARLNLELTVEKREDLCVIISEMLINAEEHSTTKFRFSIGYFHEINESSMKVGKLHLVIMNFGHSIYEKFKDPDCPNQRVVESMKALSERYTKRNFFSGKSFKEEALWTLYSLQEGVTSLAPTKYKKRGNGSIRFIESFFNLKNNIAVDDYSKMRLISGKARIDFDGTYSIDEYTNERGEKFKTMTLNESGDFNDKPDEKFVYLSNEYFPGTIISTRILINEDDLR